MAKPSTSDPPYLGELELLVLLSVLHAGDDAYGVTIARELASRGRRTISRGALYVTLDRLETKGFLRSRLDPGAPERGGRPRRIFQVEPGGLRALRQSIATVERMREGLDPLLRKP